MYTDKVLTQKVYLRTATEVPAGALALFGSGAHAKGDRVSVIEGFIELQTDGKQREAIVSTQQRLDQLLTAKLENPGLDVSAASRPLIQATIAIAQCTCLPTSTHLPAKRQAPRGRRG